MKVNRLNEVSRARLLLLFFSRDIPSDGLVCVDIFFSDVVCKCARVSSFRNGYFLLDHGRALETISP